MRITELIRGQMFRFGKQKNLRRFLEHFEQNGEHWIAYDNCKQMKIDPNTIVEATYYVEAYGTCYQTGVEMQKVQIGLFSTYISYFLKDGRRLKAVYSIQRKNKNFAYFDIREIADFPFSMQVIFDSENPLLLIKAHIESNPSNYEHLL
jgi:hypothetical protein